MKERVAQLEHECEGLKAKQPFRLRNISADDTKVRFYTGFSSMAALMVCFNFLGPSVNTLNYWSSTSASGAPEHQIKSTKGRPRLLSPLEEFFLVLVRLRLGLFEQDLAYRFGISQSTVSRIFLIISHMPKVFKDKYPSTRVIIDATEKIVQQPAIPEMQQLTFSNYHNTYKGLITHLTLWCSYISVRFVSWQHFR